MSDDERGTDRRAVSVLAEAYGRAAQRTQLTGADGGPIELEAVRERLVRKLDRLRERSPTPAEIEHGGQRRDRRRGRADRLPFRGRSASRLHSGRS